MSLKVFTKFLTFIDEGSLQNKILLDYIKIFIDKCLLFIIKRKNIIKKFKYESRF